MFLLVLAWYLLLRYWENSGKLDEWNASRIFFGMVLMVRTSKGKKSLEKVSKPRKFWRAYGELSLWVCWGAMFFVALGIILAIVSLIMMGNQQEARPVSELVAIPGLSPIIPLGWGVIAFVVCLVIHEFGHGIQARAHGMRVRNFGLLMAGPLPLGAFAEPEYTEIVNSPRRERQRMFAAGPATNIFAAFILIINTLRLAAYAKKKEIKIMRLIGASSTYIRLPFIFEAVIESLIGTSIAVGFGWAVIEYSKNSVVAESIFDITISDDYLIFLTLSLLMFSLVFGLFASFVGIRKALND